ncbi:DUF1778 domain-containing protein [Parashewanella curva]|uniref:DUF1778 domain-containing protein n=1 Tax=Parashewanella curva TaxID=2338552 RepID=A0A3L8PZX8_9GAMM|nr:DUF1778 domain-containing protein [Parashewanella curva]
MSKEKNPVGRPHQEVKLSKKQEVRCLESEKEAWKKAAKASGCSASEFMRQAANEKAAKVLKEKE